MRTHVHAEGLSRQGLKVRLQRLQVARIRPAARPGHEVNESIFVSCIFETKLNRRVHLIEINARPALLDDELDRAVNRPMVILAIF